jgi:hypothetical protein
MLYPLKKKFKFSCVVIRFHLSDDVIRPCTKSNITHLSDGVIPPCTKSNITHLSDGVIRPCTTSNITHTQHLALQQYFSHSRFIYLVIRSPTHKHEFETIKGQKSLKHTTYTNQYI